MRGRGVFLIVLLGMLSFACSGQSTVWQKVESTDAGFEILFPCKPEASKKLFQKVPKEAYLYTHKCDHKGISFSVSLPERFADFDSSRSNDELEGVETVLRSGIGAKADIKVSSHPYPNYASREFEVDSGNVYGLQLHVVHRRGVFGVQVFGKYTDDKERAQIEELSKTFIRSFKLLPNH